MNIKQILFFLMILSFISLAITGIIKFPGFLELLGVSHGDIPFASISYVHDRAGLALVGLIIIHLILNSDFIKKYLGLKK